MLMIVLLYGIFDMGFDGICLAVAFYYVVLACVSVTLVKYGGKFTSHTDVWFISLETISYLWPMTVMGVKGVLMSIWSWWVYDIFALMSSYLGPLQMAASTIMKNISLLLFMVPFGIENTSKIYIA